MLEFMDGIVEGVEEFANSTAEFAAWVLVSLTKLVILITAPVWIIPYKIIRGEKGKEGIEHE